MADNNDSNDYSSNDSFSETTSQGWLSRLGGAIKGILIGLVMVVAAFPLLFWNEGRAVRTAKSLDEGRGIVLTTVSDKVDPAKEAKLVHTTGRAKTADTVADPALGISVNAIVFGPMCGRMLTLATTMCWSSGRVQRLWQRTVS